MKQSVDSTQAARTTQQAAASTQCITLPKPVCPFVQSLPVLLCCSSVNVRASVIIVRRGGGEGSQGISRWEGNGWSGGGENQGGRRWRGVYNHREMRKHVQRKTEQVCALVAAKAREGDHQRGAGGGERGGEGRRGLCSRECGNFHPLPVCMTGNEEEKRARARGESAQQDGGANGEAKNLAPCSDCFAISRAPNKRDDDGARGKTTKQKEGDWSDRAQRVGRNAVGWVSKWSAAARQEGAISRGSGERQGEGGEEAGGLNRRARPGRAALAVRARRAVTRRKARRAVLQRRRLIPSAVRFRSPIRLGGRSQTQLGGTPTRAVALPPWGGVLSLLASPVSLCCLSVFCLLKIMSDLMPPPRAPPPPFEHHTATAAAAAFATASVAPAPRAPGPRHTRAGARLLEQRQAGRAGSWAGGRRPVTCPRRCASARGAPAG